MNIKIEIPYKLIGAQFYIKEKHSMLVFVAVDSINALNLLSVKRHLSGLNIWPAKLKTRLLANSKFLTIFSNYGLR